MNKNELIDIVSRETGTTKRVTKAVLDELLNVLASAMTGGEEVYITNFGEFRTKTMSPRTGRNPHTGEPIPIPTKVVPMFRPAEFLKCRLNQVDSSSSNR